VTFSRIKSSLRSQKIGFGLSKVNTKYYCFWFRLANLYENGKGFETKHLKRVFVINSLRYLPKLNLMYFEVLEDQLRNKRFLDPVGKLLKMTFGTLDQEDRVYYDSQLLDMWINQENFNANNEKQVTIILEIYNAAIWKFLGV
jgi:hypothetical protein